MLVNNEWLGADQTSFCHKAESFACRAKVWIIYTYGHRKQVDTRGQR